MRVVLRFQAINAQTVSGTLLTHCWLWEWWWKWVPVCNDLRGQLCLARRGFRRRRWEWIAIRNQLVPIYRH